VKDQIVPIVEGDGDIEAVPCLLYKLLHLKQEFRISVAPPKNAHGCGNLLKRGGIERFVEYARMEPRCAAVLVIVDGDACGDCPVLTAQALAARVRAMPRSSPVEIVVANREYEAWFLASWGSMLGQRIENRITIPIGATFTGNPESIRGVKEWISRQLPPGRIYKETEHQLTMTRLVDVNVARTNSRSFRRMCTALDQLLAAIPACRLGKCQC
jgi:hypothetical protein